MAVFENNEFYSMQELVRICIQEDKIDKKLQICFNLCQMLTGMTLDEPMVKVVKKMQGFTQRLLTDPEFRRAVHRRNALMEREPITYFGETIAKDDMYDFDEELEKDITSIDFEITTYLGNVLGWIQQQTGF
jgi:hypothetical protein